MKITVRDVSYGEVTGEYFREQVVVMDDELIDSSKDNAAILKEISRDVEITFEDNDLYRKNHGEIENPYALVNTRSDDKRVMELADSCFRIVECVLHDGNGYQVGSVYRLYEFDSLDANGQDDEGMLFPKYEDALHYWDKHLRLDDDCYGEEGCDGVCYNCKKREGLGG